ncbi:hypothetical protein SE23_17310 [Vibrio sinaloensis]|uniref:acyltransferase family protein n=1 Tax=Photobacterium sp. (strain ATCC 43367) TaxID=379097 RepID=UPI00057F1BCC|nr:acyltransferase family protein [Vibrio sinaloensis]KIE19473.1 hypothetical protein SE23_17310 [Vibrio sinaloensis]
MNFRQDINALRALAVLSVVIYHFNAAWLPGGFIGVDVFFVISGFLMTTILLGRQDKPKGIIEFYVARLNRIVPPLALLCVSLLIVGWFYFAGDEFETLAKHIRYSAVFTSNSTYLDEAGYFAAASKEKWLLHTWSLSIEWQFYLLYPVIILAIAKISSRQYLPLAINILLVLSLSYCCYLAYVGNTDGYFLLTARAWEMLLGSWAVFYKPKRVSSSLPGWILVLVSAFIIDHNSAWPSALTLMPTLGALIILWSNQNSRLLTVPIIQRTGLYSYSIYLWHWPVVVLFYKLNLHTPTWILIGITLSFILGAISYHTIEQLRFRRDIKSVKRLLLKCKPLWMILALVAVTKFIAEHDGFPSRSSLGNELTSIYAQLDKKVQMHPTRSKCHISRYNNNQPEDACRLFNDDPSWALIGDSHGSEIAYSLAKKLSEENDGLAQYTFSACPPSYSQPAEFSPCAIWTTEVVEHVIANPKIKDVVIAYRYSDHLYGQNEETYPELPNRYSDAKRAEILKSLREMIEILTSNGKQVYLMMPVPEMGKSIKSFVDRSYLKGQPLDNIVSMNIDYYQQRNQRFLDFMATLASLKGLHVIEVKDLFCDENLCYAVRDSIPLYFDDDHPGLLATDQIAEQILSLQP